jgi:hypothetical protein
MQSKLTKLFHLDRLTEFLDYQFMKSVSLSPQPPGTPPPPATQEISLVIVEAESTQGQQFSWKVYVNEKFHWHHWESNPTLQLVTQGLNQLRRGVPHCRTKLPLSTVLFIMKIFKLIAFLIIDENFLFLYVICS